VQFRGDRVRRLTRDHLFVVDALGLSENVAKRHPQGNILSQALGAREPVRPTLQAFDAAPGDRILLCSDGVSEVLGEQEMFDLMRVADENVASRPPPPWWPRRWPPGAVTTARPSSRHCP
jgi:protein phosphatase